MKQDWDGQDIGQLHEDYLTELANLHAALDNFEQAGSSDPGYAQDLLRRIQQVEADLSELQDSPEYQIWVENQ